ncbi:hypothetical protein V495_04637 [Pseudogymnoascus sp. VKM F-4514 (FW-929)]|nr:hypothetical protein V495_04637 [Pseudogymnoascus sp. VKM F-4514 (FW-929)]KFY51599.1 hypothetical protein V497_09003 [Pseudogymnoascus sp. VKM F-4516 (FW-969)]
MSGPTFYNYPGIGAKNSEAFHYSQAVKIGNIVKCAGQGGWDAEGTIVTGPERQVRQAMENVKKTLKAVDERLGWENVYSVKSYHLDLESTFDMMTAEFKRLSPTLRPIWTCVQVGELGIPGMVVEVEVEAWIEN